MKTACVLLLAILTFGCGTYHSPATLHVATLLPSSATAMGPQFMLTVSGSGFSAGSVVYFSAAAQPTTFVSSQQLTAMIPATAITTSGVIGVYAYTPPGGSYSSGQTSNTVNFTVN